MDDMTGRWAWRGRGAMRDPAPGGRRRAAIVARGRHGRCSLHAARTRSAWAARSGRARVGRGGGRPTDGAARRARPAPRPAGLRRAAGAAALQRAAAWSWRLLVVGLLIYVVFRVASALAPGGPAVHRGAAAHRPAAAADRAAAPDRDDLARRDVVHGHGRGRDPGRARDPDREPGKRRLPRLQNEVKHTAHEVQSSLAGSPFHLSSPRLDQYYDQFTHFLSQHKSLIAGTVVTGGKISWSC